ncbi:MAG TPA: HypC/HybG/HupF family hydrogenase formation chaperone [Candidatus Aenigmarchaeota archaeon]|nr:MAG: HypC/HybG/HupF family hydrogenase formation chaperone [Candidatus Aenigmarchaeota archaeon]HDD45959.1 HypC/HybG/HupF family hydrogenase formation chaperone [Candidatus Aenigmarchaeota archaeon]
MCLAFPGRVVKIYKKKEKALIDFGNVKRDVNITLLPKVRVGDLVMVHAGFAIERVEENELM